MFFQDICRGVTERESGICQNTSSYVLVYDTCIAVNNLLTIFSRLRHCETYVFALELETALAKALDEVFISLSSLIITGEGNEVFILSGTI